MNSGTIKGDVQLWEGVNSLDNLDGGSISGRILGGGGGNTVVNAGTISVQSGGAIIFGAGADRVLNSGTINGNVVLGDGGNFLDSTTGHIFGTITSGSGADIIRVGDLDANVSSGAGSDIIRGGAGDDFLQGGADSDNLFGRGGQDTLDAGDGASSNRLYGGADNDIYIIRNASDIVDERVFGGTGLDTIRVLGNFSFSLSDRTNVRGDVEDLVINGITQLENINGTGNALANTITGNSGANVLRGLDGDDELFGRTGNDILQGGNGDDILTGGAGADRINGGAGVDWANYDQAGVRVTVNLDGSGPGVGEGLGDQFTSVENLRGSDLVLTVGDQLRGDGGANMILGLRGDDALYGESGNDRLHGGLGSDTMTGGLDSDLFAFDTAAEGGDRILDFNSALDSFAFLSGAFAGLTADNYNGASNFVVRGDNVAQDFNDYFILTTDASGVTLWFDADGNGAVAAVLIATVLGDMVQASDITFL